MRKQRTGELVFDRCSTFTWLSIALTSYKNIFSISNERIVKEYETGNWCLYNSIIIMELFLALKIFVLKLKSYLQKPSWQIHNFMCQLIKLAINSGKILLYRDLRHDSTYTTLIIEIIHIYVVTLTILINYIICRPTVYNSIIIRLRHSQFGHGFDCWHFKLWNISLILANISKRTSYSRMVKDIINVNVRQHKPFERSNTYLLNTDKNIPYKKMQQE